MKNKSLKRSTLTTVLYILAVLMLVYGVYMIFNSVAYLSSYFQTYSTTMASNFKDSFNYIISSSLSYFVYAVLFFAAAKIHEAVRALDPKNFESLEDVEAKKAAREAQKRAKEEAKAKVAAEKAAKEAKSDKKAEKVEEKVEDKAEEKAEESK